MNPGRQHISPCHGWRRVRQYRRQYDGGTNDRDIYLGDAQWQEGSIMIEGWVPYKPSIRSISGPERPVHAAKHRHQSAFKDPGVTVRTVRVQADQYIRVRRHPHLTADKTGNLCRGPAARYRGRRRMSFQRGGSGDGSDRRSFLRQVKEPNPYGAERLHQGARAGFRG